MAEDSGNVAIDLEEQNSCGPPGYDEHVDSSEQNSGDVPGDELTSQTLDSNDRRPFHESLWDGCLFVFTKPVGWEGSAFSMLALLLNITMQLGFCIIVYLYMLEPSVTNQTLSQLLKFRTGVAHDIGQSDKFTRQSMVSQMCQEGGNDKIHQSSGQLSLRIGVEQFRQGGIPLTLLVQICWLGSIFKDLADQYLLTTAVLRLPSGPKTVLTANNSEGLSTGIKCISRRRIAFFLFVVALPRLIIAIVLGVTGAMFLSTTESMGDLVLNAVALGFVFDLDELLFSIMAPRRMYVLIDTMKPLQSYPMRPGLRPLLMILGLCATLSVITLNLTIPFHWRLNMASEILCGGVRDFVYAENAATGMLHVARSSVDASAWTERELAVLQVARPKLEDKYGWGIDPEVVRISQGGDEFAVPTTGWEVTTQSFDAVTEATDDAYGVLLSLQSFQTGDVSSVMSCSDLSFETPSVQNYLSERFGMPDLDGCQDERLLPFCSQRNMTFLRALCPERCGCSYDLVFGHQTGFFNSVEYGCPSACNAVWQLHKDSTAQESGQWSLFMHVSADALDVIPDLSSRSSYSEGYPEEYVQFYDWVARYFRGVGEVMVARPLEWWRLFGSVHSLATGEYENKFCLDYPYYYYYDDSEFEGCEGLTVTEYVDYAMAGGVATSLLDGQWKLHPDVPHPRGLKGCQFLTSWEVSGILGMDLCSVGQFTSIRSLCPNECSCAPGMEECPTYAEDYGLYYYYYYYGSGYDGHDSHDNAYDDYEDEYDGFYDEFDDYDEGQP